MASRHRLLLLPIVLLAVALAVFYPALKKLPVGGLRRIPSRAGAVKSEVKIWANKRSGLYFCPDSKLYGKLTPGNYMLQGEALQHGYQPASKEICR
jgi:hypothetical protein